MFIIFANFPVSKCQNIASSFVCDLSSPIATSGSANNNRVCVSYCAIYTTQAPSNQHAIRLQPRPFNVTSSARRFAWVFIAAVLQQTERAVYQRSPRTDARQLDCTRMQHEDMRANRGGLGTCSRAEAVALEVSSMKFAQAKLRCRAQSSRLFLRLWVQVSALCCRGGAGIVRQDKGPGQ